MYSKEVSFNLTDGVKLLNRKRLAAVQIKINRYFTDNFIFRGDEEYFIRGIRVSHFSSPEFELKTIASLPLYWARLKFCIEGTEFREGAIGEQVSKIENIIKEA